MTLKEIGAIIVATLLVIVCTMEIWWWLIPERFTVRYLLLVATALAMLFGAWVVWAPH